jgi:hypothetical protein
VTFPQGYGYIAFFVDNLSDVSWYSECSDRYKFLKILETK